jgi:hypothetical protein
MAPVDDASRFLDQWGRETEEFGWGTNSLFNPPKIASSDEMTGLCWLLTGRSVVRLDACSATLDDGYAFWKAPP